MTVDRLPQAPGRPEELTFAGPDAASHLDGLDADEFDRLAFGVIAMDRAGVVVAYNRFESERAGIGRDRVLGRDFFRSVGPCTNNHLVAGRYPGVDQVASADLDEELDFVFTFRMRPTPVRLRLLARAGSRRQYLLVRPR